MAKWEIYTSTPIPPPTYSQITIFHNIGQPKLTHSYPSRLTSRKQTEFQVNAEWIYPVLLRSSKQPLELVSSLFMCIDGDMCAPLLRTSVGLLLSHFVELLACGCVKRCGSPSRSSFTSLATCCSPRPPAAFPSEASVFSPDLWHAEIRRLPRGHHI